MNQLRSTSVTTSPRFFERSSENLSNWLFSCLPKEWKAVEDWGYHIASQLPVDILENTPYYFDVQGIHLQSRPGTDNRERIIQWLKRIWHRTELLDEKKVTSHMRLLTLHCPAAPGCKTAFECDAKSASEESFRIEIIGFGSGSKHISEYNETLLLSAAGRCVEIWVPVIYSVRRYHALRLSKKEIGNIFYTVDPISIGEDVEVKRAPCSGGKCAIIAAFDEPQASFSLVANSAVEKNIAYDVGSTVTADMGVQLPSVATATLTAMVVFNYRVSYRFELHGPGHFLAYNVSYLPKREEVPKQHSPTKRTLIRAPGYAWKWDLSRTGSKSRLAEIGD